MTTLSRDFTIDVRRLRVLRAVEQHGTVSAAAAALHLTPSAVSQQVASLSRELGVTLLEKRGRGVRLTGRARLLLEHAAVVEEQLERARAELAAWDAGEAGHLAIGSLSTGISSLVAPAMTALRDSHPGLRLTVTEAEAPDLFGALDVGDVDVAVAVDHRPSPPRTDPRYHRVDLLTDPLDAVLPTGHPLAGRSGVRLEALAEEAWVSGAPGGSCAEITLAVCAIAGFSPDVRHRCGDWEAVGALVAAGAGVALVPRLAQPLHPAGLAVVPVVGTPASRHLFAAVRAGAQHDPLTMLLLDALTTVAARTPRTAP